ncbi:MAG: hypothetical protein KF722_03565 [Nitrospira sp.]|nr:hypothetical protein [Nitrospira sp.]
MAKKALALVRKGSKPQTEAGAPHHNRERALSEDWLFQGKDEVGHEGWFLCLEVTGMYPRRCGPFTTHEEACEFLEGFLNGYILEALCDTESEMDRPHQTRVVKGVPQLTATT